MELPFTPHPNLGDELNREIIDSEIEGGVRMQDLPIGAVLDVETGGRTYTIENLGNGQAWISGHPHYCPTPVLVKLRGSTWGRAPIRQNYVGRGMRLEFRHPEYGVVRTSRIRDIHQRAA